MPLTPLGWYFLVVVVLPLVFFHVGVVLSVVVVVLAKVDVFVVMVVVLVLFLLLLMFLVKLLFEENSRIEGYNKMDKQAEAEVVPSSSLVEVGVGGEVEV